MIGNALVGAVVVLLLGAQSGAEPPFKSGLRHFKFVDAERDERPVWVDLWYPAPNSVEEKAQSFGIGGTAAWNASFAAGEGPFPVVVLSHGALGSARNYGWLGSALARRGYVVVGVSHYAESWLYGPKTVDPSAVLRLWERPLDLSLALTRMLELGELRGLVDPERVVAVGHSSGGNTAIALAGATFDPARMGQYCGSGAARDDRGCGYADSGREESRRPPEEASASYRDDRIRAIVAMDPAVGPGYSPESLAKVRLPVLVIGAVDNDFLPFESHAKHYAEGIADASLIALDQGEGHFVFLDECDNELEANGVPLCTDRAGVDRASVHRRIETEVLRFLAGVLE